MSMRNCSIIDLRQVLEAVPYSRAHLYRLEKAGSFPKRVKLGPNRVGWVKEEVTSWLAARIEARSAPVRSNDREGVAL